MNFTIAIASVSNRDDVVAEVWWGDALVAEVHRAAGGELQIDIYPTESRDPWSFDLKGWLATLAEAQQKLG
jgi:hypothetical protein